jgi:hypothetical protein
MSQLKNICKKYKKDVNDKQVIELKELLENNMGYFSKFSEFLFSGNSTIEELRNIVELLKNIKINKPIHEFKSSEQLYDHLTEIDSKRKLNQVLKSIPSNSRKNVSKRIEYLIYNNIDSVEIFKDFFSKKGGSCKTESHLYEKIKELIKLSKGDSSYKATLEKIQKHVKDEKSSSWWFFKKPEKTTSEIVYSDGSVIVLRVDDFETSEKLGSPHWCISSGRDYFNSYTSNNRKQYFIYQTDLDITDKKRLIGVTMYSNGEPSNIHNSDDSIGDFSDISYLYKYLTLDLDINLDINDVISYNIMDLDLIENIRNKDFFILFNNNDLPTVYNYVTKLIEHIYEKETTELYKRKFYQFFVYKSFYTNGSLFIKLSKLINDVELFNYFTNKHGFNCMQNAVVLYNHIICNILNIASGEKMSLNDDGSINWSDLTPSYISRPYQHFKTPLYNEKQILTYINSIDPKIKKYLKRNIGNNLISDIDQKEEDYIKDFLKSIENILIKHYGIIDTYSNRYRYLYRQRMKFNLIF